MATKTSTTPVNGRSDSSDSDSSETTKSFKDRLEDMPAYNIAVSNLQNVYGALKGSGYFTRAFTTGEDVAVRFTAVAKPVVMAATGMACCVAKPVVGEITDPGASIDGCAAEILAKVQEKLPWVRQDPREYVESVKTSAIGKVESVKSSTKNTATYYIDKVQGMMVTQTAVQQLVNVVAMGDLIVELVLPIDTSCEDDIAELDKEEEEEDHGVIAHANCVRRKAVRRGKRKLMSYKPVQTSVDMVNRINEIPSVVMNTVKNVRENEVVKDIKEKAVAFAYVHTQIVTDYLQLNLVVLQWIIPNHLRTESIQMIEISNDTTESEAKK